MKQSTVQSVSIIILSCTVAPAQPQSVCASGDAFLNGNLDWSTRQQQLSK